MIVPDRVAKSLIVRLLVRCNLLLGGIKMCIITLRTLIEQTLPEFVYLRTRA